MLKIDESKVIRKFEVTDENEISFHKSVGPFIFYAGSAFMILINIVAIVQDGFLAAYEGALATLALNFLFYLGLRTRIFVLLRCYFFENELVLTFSDKKILYRIRREDILAVEQKPFLMQRQYLILRRKKGKKILISFADQNLLKELIEYFPTWLGRDLEFVGNHFQREKSLPLDSELQNKFWSEVNLLHRTIYGKIFYYSIIFLPIFFIGVGFWLTDENFIGAFSIGFILFIHSKIWDPSHEFIPKFKKPLFGLFLALFVWTILKAFRSDIIQPLSLEFGIFILSLMLVFFKRFYGKTLRALMLVVFLRWLFLFVTRTIYGFDKLGLAIILLYSFILSYYFLENSLRRLGNAILEDCRKKTDPKSEDN